MALHTLIPRELGRKSLLARTRFTNSLLATPFHERRVTSLQGEWDRNRREMKDTISDNEQLRRPSASAEGNCGVHCLLCRAGNVGMTMTISVLPSSLLTLKEFGRDYVRQMIRQIQRPKTLHEHLDSSLLPRGYELGCSPPCLGPDTSESSKVENLHFFSCSVVGNNEEAMVSWGAQPNGRSPRPSEERTRGTVTIVRGLST